VTTAQKTGTALATALAILTVVLGSQSLPVIKFLFGELRAVLALPLTVPVMVAVIVGAVSMSWLPHLLPRTWPAHRTKRVTRLLGFATAFLMIVSRYPNAIGIQFGLFAGTGAYVLWTVVAGFVYRALPQTKPESLDDPS
jgi:hypothetical protein